jgi:acetolactate synthase-1/2/3 large subunit
VETPDGLRPAVRRALAAPGSYLIDVKTDPETRMKRAIPGVVPNLFDRSPAENSALDAARRRPHYHLTLDNAWPQ